MSANALPAVAAPSLDQIREARVRLRGMAIETPLVRLNWTPPAGSAGAAEFPEIWLKLENLQPIGSFKVRGAANAMLQAGRERLAEGVVTVSAGNMAQGVAWSARELGVRATAVVPEGAPETKIAAIERLGGRVVKVPFERWWQVIVEHSFPEVPGVFVHPVSDTAVMAGNGTIALEILDQLPDVDAVLVPYGGGGLSCGIAAGLRALRPEAAVYGCEVATAAPLSVSLAAGAPQTVDYQPTFVDGIGSRSLLAEMWAVASQLLAGARVVPLAAIAGAVRLLVERQRVVAEGAGAASVAAALAPWMGEEADRPAPLAARKIVCIVSGGNIDTAKLATILGGGVP
jgi:threonine dehydratase